MADVERSGDIHQHDTGTSIAHTGSGDVKVQIADATITVGPAIVSAVAAGAPSPAGVRRTLPRDIPEFTGRGDELQALLKAVDEGAETGKPVLIYAIDGMAGVGKTTLAVHAAHRLASRFPDGQLFLPLHAHAPGQQPVEPGDALAALLRRTGMDPRQIPAGMEEREQLWRDRLAGKKILLLLDDAATHEQVQPLTPGTGGSAVLVTSRRRLTALAGVLPLELDIMPPGQAANLFTSLSGCGGNEPEAVAALVELAGRLPLAIQMLGARLRSHRSWTVADLAGELAAAQDRSAAIGATDMPVSAAFDLSYNTLPTHRQQFFRHLGLQPGPSIDVYAAAALTGLGLDQAGAELDALFSIHLIDEPARGRYRFHDLLGDYARALATTDPPCDQDTAIGRLLNYYQHTAQAANRRLARRAATGTSTDAPPMCMPDLSTRERAMAWMDAERSNLHAAVDHAARHNWLACASAIPAAMSRFLLTSGHWDQARMLHQAALEAARVANDRCAEAYSLINLGDAQRLTGNYPAAAASLEQALQLCRALGDRLGEADALNKLGTVQDLSSNYPAAATSHQQALRLFRALGDRLGEANALHELGTVQRLTGEIPAATASLEQALDVYRTLQDQHGRANTLNQLGAAHRMIGNYPAATASLVQALRLFRALGDRLGEANALNELGTVQRLTGDIPAATASHRKAHELYRTLGERLGEANALNCLGVVQQATHEYAVAHASQQRALDLYRTLGARDGAAEAINNMGELAQASATVADALCWYNQALAIARDVAVPLEEARALEGIGRCQLQSGHSDQARPLLREALAIYQRLRSPLAQGVQAIIQKHRLN
jgi:tetratricopeptide (TPR) repeat protein